MSALTIGTPVSNAITTEHYSQHVIFMSFRLESDLE